MADDTRESQGSGSSPVTPADPDPPKKFPKGVVLGKDGKPCRSCTSFAAWALQTKSNLKTPTQTQTKPSSDVLTPAVPRTPTDCPADVETLGRSTWTLLHSIAATYPKTPTPNEQADLKSFMKLLSKLYPCWVCAEDFRQYIKKEDIRTESRDEFGNWLCQAHNEVNRKLGKPTFDCSRWEERWRTGWKDGRCD